MREARKKGHYGSGSIDPSGEKSWRIRYRINGRRFAKTIRGTKTDAAKELRRLLASADEGIHVAPNKITFAKWVDQWLALKARSIAGQTLDRYEDALKTHVIPALGSKQMQRITATDIDRLYSGLTLAPGTMTQLNFVLKSCLQSAVKKKLITANPVEDAEKPARNEDEIGVVLEEDQLSMLVAGFKRTSLYGIVAVAAFTGMRKGEVLALRWIDIDLDAMTISISRNVQETKIRPTPTKGPKIVRSIKKPKTKRGVRTIQIDAGLAALLRQERDRHLRLVAGIPDGSAVDLSLIRLPGDALCFPSIGTDLTALRSPHSIYDMFAKHARTLGFDMRFHDLRGTHSTIMLDKGVPVHVVAKRIGDDPATLLRSYAKRTKKADASAANVIGTLTKGVL
jgi:integrase